MFYFRPQVYFCDVTASPVVALRLLDFCPARLELPSITLMFCLGHVGDMCNTDPWASYPQLASLWQKERSAAWRVIRLSLFFGGSLNPGLLRFCFGRCSTRLPLIFLCPREGDREAIPFHPFSNASLNVLNSVLN